MLAIEVERGLLTEDNVDELWHRLEMNCIRRRYALSVLVYKMSD